MAYVRVAAVAWHEGEADMGSRRRSDEIGPLRDLPCVVDDLRQS